MSAIVNVLICHYIDNVDADIVILTSYDEI